MPKDTGQEEKQNVLYELSKLPPLSKLPLKQHSQEIENRLSKLYADRQQSKIPIMPAHIQAALGISSETYLEYLSGTARARVQRIDGVARENVPADAAKIKDEDVLLMRARSAVLAKWVKLAEVSILDTATNPDYKGGQTGSIKMAEYLGYKTSEQLEVTTKGDDLSQALHIWRERERKKAAKAK